MRSSAVDPEWRAVHVISRFITNSRSSPRFASLIHIRSDGREGSRHAVAAGLCLWLTGFCWWHIWFKCNRKSMKMKKCGIYLFTCTNRNLINLSVSYSVLRVWRKVWRLSRGFTCSTTRTRRTSDTASLHVHKDPAYFSPVINHLETLITAYIKHGMKFEFYSLHFMHFSYCDILFVGFHRHVLM